MNAKENFMRAVKRCDPKYVPYYILGEPELDEGVLKFVDYKGNFTGPGTEGIDDWGVHWVPTAGEGKDMVCHPKEFPLESVEDIDTYKFPGTDKFELKEESEMLLQKIARDEVIVVGCHYYCLFERAWALMGMENFLIALYVDLDRVKRLLRGIADYHIGVAEHYINLGVDGCWFTEDIGSQKALIMHPEMWREVFKPELQRIIEPYKKANKLVFFHSCGHIMEIVGDLVEVGVDVLHPIQARANDLRELKQRYGSKITYMGGIDTQYTLMRGTPKEVEIETIQRLKDLAPGGGYVAGPDQSMPFPRENIEALVNTVKKYGEYPLRFTN